MDGGPGDDDIVVAGPPFQLLGGAGADLLDARLAPGSAISYADHTADVTVRLNGLPDDGAAGEGDNVLGSLGASRAGPGTTRSNPARTRPRSPGERATTRWWAAPRASRCWARRVTTTSRAEAATTASAGGEGADLLAGGPGHDEASYAGAAQPLRLSIGDGPGDGAVGENDDILADVEDLIGGPRADVMIGTAEANRLVGLGGADRMVGGEGADRLEGAGDGDRAGRRVLAPTA